jgi:phosphonate metabolism protein PhnN/1,5-bisphosphokinase (PRPP-forming)
MSKCFLIIGNSGAGKDSVIEEVERRFPPHYKKLMLPKRVITRKNSDTEKFESVDTETFHKLRKSGEFILEWESYEHFYGIRREVLDWLDADHPVLLNISRQVVQTAREKIPDAMVIFIRVPLDVTADRIIDRGRESYKEVLDRVVRAQEHQDSEEADFVVNNVGNLGETSQKVLEYILESIGHDSTNVTKLDRFF